MRKHATDDRKHLTLLFLSSSFSSILFLCLPPEDNRAVRIYFVLIFEIPLNKKPKPGNIEINLSTFSKML